MSIKVVNSDRGPVTLRLNSQGVWQGVSNPTIADELATRVLLLESVIELAGELERMTIGKTNGDDGFFEIYKKIDEGYLVWSICDTLGQQASTAIEAACLALGVTTGDQK